MINGDNRGYLHALNSKHKKKLFAKNYTVANNNKCRASTKRKKSFLYDY